MPLVLLGAPLGNVGDVSPRVAEVLTTADVVAAEDTRRLGRLTTDLGVVIRGRVVSFFEGNEERRVPELVEALADGATVAVITDGGMPTVSDPGFRLVRAAVVAGVPVTAVPGPSAVTTALALSGLPCDRFCFEGFLPRRPGERRARLADLADETRTLVFYEAPHRVADTLADLAEAFGADRSAALARELTKTYEEVIRAPLGELARASAEQPPRGEITLVVGGAVGTGDGVAASPLGARGVALAAAVSALETVGTPRKVAMAAVAAAYRVAKREVYDAVVRAR